MKKKNGSGTMINLWSGKSQQPVRGPKKVLNFDPYGVQFLQSMKISMHLIT